MSPKKNISKSKEKGNIKYNEKILLQTPIKKNTILKKESVKKNIEKKTLNKIMNIIPIQTRSSSKKIIENKNKKLKEKNTENKEVNLNKKRNRSDSQKKNEKIKKK